MKTCAVPMCQHQIGLKMRKVFKTPFRNQCEFAIFGVLKVQIVIY